MTTTATTAASRADGSSETPALIGCVLTKDEERNIRRAVESLLKATDTIVVVDSGSTDDTISIAKELGAVVWEHPYETYPAQRNWALDEIERQYGAAWVFHLDADEWLSDELAAELRERVPTFGTDADFYLTRLRRRFDGRILRYGGFGVLWLTRIMHTQRTRYEGEGFNEHLTIPEDARIARLEGWLEHGDVDDWNRYIAKHNRYSSQEAQTIIELKSGRAKALTLRDVAQDPTLKMRYLRERVWNRLPVSLKPAIRFFQIYVAFGGFLDGRSGLRRAVFEAWQEMTTDLKVEEIQRRGADR